MSLIVSRHDYPVDVDRDRVYEELTEMVIHESNGRARGLVPISWLSAVEVKDCKKDAEEFLKTYSRNTPGNFAVRYRKWDDQNPSKAFLVLKKHREKASQKLLRLQGEVYVSTLKSKSITCKKCGSQLNIKAMVECHSDNNPNRCPVCYNELRSERMLDAIQKAACEVKALDVLILKEERRMAEHHSEIRWLVEVWFPSS